MSKSAADSLARSEISPRAILADSFKTFLHKDKIHMIAIQRFVLHFHLLGSIGSPLVWSIVCICSVSGAKILTDAPARLRCTRQLETDSNKVTFVTGASTYAEASCISVPSYTPQPCNIYKKTMNTVKYIAGVQNLQVSIQNTEADTHTHTHIIYRHTGLTQSHTALTSHNIRSHFHINQRCSSLAAMPMSVRAPCTSQTTKRLFIESIKIQRFNDNEIKILFWDSQHATRHQETNQTNTTWTLQYIHTNIEGFSPLQPLPCQFLSCEMFLH